MEITIEGKTLVIRMPINDPLVLSKSQKSYLVATSNGVITTQVQVQGKALKIGVNAFVEK